MSPDGTFSDSSLPFEGAELPTLAMSGTSMAGTSTSTHHIFPSVPGYQVIRFLGQGGMGTVWRAIQLAANREVALKVMRIEFVDFERSRRRFEREVELTSRLNHPNIARLYDSGLRQGVYFYAMELVEGESLDAYIHKQKLPRPGVLEMMRVIADAVRHAHQVGIIHRDLKPLNILVDTAGSPRILDFGLAKESHITGSAPAISLDGEVAGTLEYMSPEQAAGKADQIDIRSDTYSLGVILYRLLTGESPHVLSGSRYDVMRRIIEEEVTPPRKHAADLDSEIVAILLKALCKNPAGRYQTALQLAEDLAKYLQGEPISACHPTFFYYARKKLWKYRLYCALIGTAVSVIIGLAIHGSLRVRRERDLKEQELVKEIELNANLEASRRSDAGHLRASELRLAVMLVYKGGVLARQGEERAAEGMLHEAQGLFQRHNVSGFPADLALFNLYLKTPPPLRTVNGGPHFSVKAVEFDPERGEVIAVGTHGQIAIWPVTSARPRILRSNVGTLLAASVHPATRTVVLIMETSGSATTSGHAAEIWDLDRGTSRSIVVLPSGIDARAVVSRDGRRGAIISAKSGDEQTDSVTIYDLATGAPSGEAIHRPQITNAAFVADDNAIAISADTGKVKVEVIDLATGRPRATARCGDSAILTLRAMTRDTGVFIDNSGDVGAFDLTGTHASRTLGHQADLTGAICVVDSRLALGAARGAVALIDPASSMPRRLSHGDSAVTAVGLSDHGLVLAGATDGTIDAWDTSAVAPPRSAPLHSAIGCVAVSPDGGLFCLGGARELIVGDVATGRILMDFSAAHKSTLYAAAFSPSLARICSADADGKILLHDPRDGSTRILDSGMHRINGACFSMDCSRALCWGALGLREIDLETGQIRSLGNTARETAAYSADGRTIAAVSPNRELLLWAAHPGVPTATQATADAMMAFSYPIDSIAVNNDGTAVLCADTQGVLRCIDPRSKTVRWSAQATPSRVRRCAILAGGTVGMTSSTDGICKLWDLDTGQEFYRTDQFGQPGDLAVAANERVMVGCTEGQNSAFIVDLKRPHELLAPLTVPGPPATQSANDDQQRGIELMLAYAARGRFDWATTLARQTAKSTTPLSIPNRLTVARTLWQCGRPAEAAAEFQRIPTAQTPDATSIYVKLCLDACRREQAVDDK